MAPPTGAVGSMRGSTRTASTRPAGARPVPSRTRSPPNGDGHGPPIGASCTTAPRRTRRADRGASARSWCGGTRKPADGPATTSPVHLPASDRKSTRLNSSHVANSYVVFCLQKKHEADKHAEHAEKQHM